MTRFALIVSFLLVSSPAYAYIDPGIGAFVLQGLVAAVAVVGVAFGTARQRVRQFVSQVFGRSSSEKKEKVAEPKDDDTRRR